MLPRPTRHRIHHRTARRAPAAFTTKEGAPRADHAPRRVQSPSRPRVRRTFTIRSLRHEALPPAIAHPAVPQVRSGARQPVRGARTRARRQGRCRALRCVYASGWASTGARGVLASTTMIDAYTVVDTILLTDHFPDHDGPGAAPLVQGGAYSDDVLASDDVDLESIPWEIEEGMREKRIMGYDQ